MESNLTFITLGSKTLYIRGCVHAKLLQLCQALCDPMDCSPPGSSVHGDSPGKNAGVVCHALLQGIFPTQRLNPCLLHCRWVLYLSHRGGPYQRISLVQFSRSVVSDSLRPHELQRARPPCPSPTPGVTQTHVYQVDDAIQRSHPLSSPSPPVFNLSQHQGLFQ